VRLPDGIDGPFYVLALTDSPAFQDRSVSSSIGFNNFGVAFEQPREMPDGDRLQEAARLLARGNVAEYQNEGNNTAQTSLTVHLTPPPDLQVTNLTAPTRVRMGQEFSITYTVSNLGGDTPGTQTSWDDLIYLSRDRFLDLQADRFLDVVRHEGGLAAGQADTITRTLRAPAGLSQDEEYYVFVIADPPRSTSFGSVFELDRETNNHRVSDQPLIVELPPPTDLTVTGITVPRTAAVGDAITLTWTVKNQSQEPAEGTWTDTAYLSADATWDLGDVPLGRVEFTGGMLAADSAYTLTLNTKLPPVTPGAYHVIVRTDIFDQVYEREFEANNRTASADTLTVAVPEIRLGVPFATTLSAGEQRLFQIRVPQDQTLQVDLTSDAQKSANELFLRYNAAPTPVKYDAAYEGGLAADVRAVIPSTQPGVYYVLIRGFAEPADDTPVQLLARVVPLAITSVNTDVGGDAKYVTTTIRGVRFASNAIVKLVRPGIAEYEPVAYRVIDATKIIASFDFTGAPHGLYDLEVINPNGEAAVIPYRFLVEQAIEPDVTIGVGGPRVIWPATWAPTA
jgi:hypothetical protein